MTPPHTGPGGGDGSAERLSCGSSTDELLDQVAEGRGAVRDTHQIGCPYCQATLTEYTRLWAPVTELAAAPVRAPDGLFDEVLAGVRAAAGPPGWGRVDDGGGHFLVAARVVVAVAGHAARTTAGVRMALGALAQLADALDQTGDLAGRRAEEWREEAGRVEAGVIGHSVALELTVAADYGQDLHRLADRLRARVTTEVRAMTGLDTVEISVTIDDVLPPRAE